MESSVKEIKTLLRYPGGKTRGMSQILPHLTGHDVVVSPFFGGGVLEIALARRGVRVHAYDAMEPLVNFWDWVKRDPMKLADMVGRYQNVDREEYYRMRNDLRDYFFYPGIMNAAKFFVTNRLSFGGVFSSGYSYHAAKRTDMLSGAEKIRNFNFPDTLTVEQQDFADTLNKHREEFLYCDPPYMNAKAVLYGFRGELHKNFDHEKLQRLLSQRNKWVLSYGDCPEVRQMYSGHQQTSLNWKYGKDGTVGNELLILSGDG